MNTPGQLLLHGFVRYSQGELFQGVDATDRASPNHVASDILGEPSMALMITALRPRQIYIHYGGSYAGPAPKEFLNFDASPTLRLERMPLIGNLVHKNPIRFPVNVMYGDITKGPLVQPGTAQGVYCSHVLEHLSYRDCQLALKHSFSMLEPGGIFRFVFPDLKQIANDYMAGRIDANEFMKESGLGAMSRSKGMKGFIKSFFGNSAHLWLWDENSISDELARAGFDGIRRAYFGDSPDPMFSLVESRGRWEGQLGIECHRP